ncbi:MAG: imidazole glycerol phosphate synthase subunit HisH [Marinagarivorans sp.]
MSEPLPPPMPHARIAIIDLGIGNINSVEKALKSLGAEVFVQQDYALLNDATHYILPGVGSFAAASQAMVARGGVTALNNLVGDKPLLGICVGMQLFARSGAEHGVNPGLGWVDGEVGLLPVPLPLPHVGWNDITPVNDCPLFFNMPAQPCFYFTHSFAFTQVPVQQAAAYCTYGHSFVAAVQAGRRYAVQFHPEKSQQLGLLLLRNFLQFG